MEFNTLNAITKYGADDYELWNFRLPREKAYEIRQGPLMVEGGTDRVLNEIRLARHQSPGTMNIIIPQSTGLKLFTPNMGEDFREKSRYNGSTTRGSREAVKIALLEALKKQGYYLRGNAFFENVDVLAAMREIVDHNTDYYKTDFQYDMERLREAAEDRNAPKQFFWMSRKSGTWCFPERDVFINYTSSHNTWLYYGGERSESIKVFWVELKRYDDDKHILGDMVELDYQKHLDYLCTHSVDPMAVEVVFKNPNDCRTFSRKEYEENWQSIGQRYGTVDRVTHLVENPGELARSVYEARGLVWDTAERMSVDEYVKRLDYDRLHDFGYTDGDMELTGPADAFEAVRHGLVCYALHPDGSKEQLADKDSYQKAHYDGKLFGMAAEEKDLLRYFVQGAVPLFSCEELRTICTLAVQAGMENDPTHATLLDGIIHKAECALPQEDQGEIPAHETEYEREE